MASNITPRVYFASLSAYNNGILHGAWVDLEFKDEDQIQEEINAMLKTCPEGLKGEPSEEWAIHDFELGGIKIGESESLADLVKIAEALENHGEAFVMAYDNFGNVDEAVTACEDSYQGVHDSLTAYAEDYMEQTGGLSECPEVLRRYFDFEAFGRDCENGGDIWTARGSEGLHVFSNN
jgi:antirestriction protein